MLVLELQAQVKGVDSQWTLRLWGWVLNGLSGCGGEVLNGLSGCGGRFSDRLSGLSAGNFIGVISNVGHNLGVLSVNMRKSGRVCHGRMLLTQNLELLVLFLYHVLQF